MFNEMKGVVLSDSDKEKINRFQLIEPNKLVLAEWDIHKQDDMKLNKLSANIDKNGQLINIQVRELDNGMYEIIDGRKRYEALLNKPFILCYNHGPISKEAAQRIALETDIKFDNDNIAIAEIINSISQVYGLDDLASTMQYNKEELQDFQKLFEFDWSQFSDEKQEETELDKLTTEQSNEHNLMSISIDLNEEDYKRWNELKSKRNLSDSALLILLMDNDLALESTII